MAELVEVEYSSNNSGGGWWLKDADWIALEKAGWFVEWSGLYFCTRHFRDIPAGKPDCGQGDKCQGHRIAESAEEAAENRYLGALAKAAKKKFPSMEAAVREWEEITGQDSTDEGCNCCGAPHYFNVRGGE